MIHIWLRTITSRQLSIFFFNVTWLFVFFCTPAFVTLFISHLSVFSFYFLNIIVSFWLCFLNFIFFSHLVGGISWCICLLPLPTDPNFLNFTGPMLFVLESCAVGFTITPLEKEWSWSVSLWETLWC